MGNCKRSQNLGLVFEGRSWNGKFTINFTVRLNNNKNIVKDRFDAHKWKVMKHYKQINKIKSNRVD